MTPQIALWVLSTLGAVLFFGLGWVSSVMRRPSVQTAGAGAPLPLEPGALERSDAALAELQGQLESHRAALHRAEQEKSVLTDRLRAAERSAGQLDVLTKALEGAKARAADRDALAQQLEAERNKPTDGGAKQQLQALAHRYERLQQERNSLADRLRLAERSEAQVVALTKTLEAAKARAADLAQQLDATRGKQADAAGSQQQLQAIVQRLERDKRTLQERAKAETDELRKEVTTYQQAQEKLKSDLANARKQVESARISAGSESKQLAAQLHETQDQLRVANTKIQQLEALRQDLEQARQQLADAREMEDRSSDAARQVTQLSATVQALKLELSQAQSRLAASDQDREHRHELVEENEQLRANVARSVQFEEQERQLRQKLQALEARAEEAEALREHNAELRDQLRDLQRFEEDAKQLSALETELRSAKLDNEMLRRRVEEAGSDPDSRIELHQQLEEARRRATDADALQRRVDALEARLFALDLAELPADTRRSRTLGHHEAALEDAPSCLIRVGAKTAVLADNAGLPVASAGIAKHQESLAALSGLALEFADRVRTLLPVSTIRLVRLIDERQMNVYWSLFDSRGERYALSGVGEGMPDDSLLDDAVTRAKGAVDRAGGAV